MKRRVVPNASAGADLPPVRPKFADAFPCLWEHLTSDRFDDGSSRETSTVMFFHDGSYLKCMLKDRAEGLVAFVSGVDFDACLLGLEGGLGSNSLDWRRDQKPGVRGKRK